jgi:hypothetical protein
MLFCTFAILAGGKRKMLAKTTKIAIMISLTIMQGRKSIRNKKVFNFSHLFKHYWQRSKKDAGRGNNNLALIMPKNENEK